jgi:uncharacterized membrane protein HdeD (DUF308 family)
MAKIKSIPTGVKVISVLDYIGAGLFALFGVIMLIVGIIALANPSFLQDTPDVFLTSIAGFIGILMLIGGIILIGLSVLSFFVARGLWKGKNWARIVSIIFAGIGVIFSIIAMTQGNILNNLFNLAINLVIGGYLLFSSSVKKAFA